MKKVNVEFDSWSGKVVQEFSGDTWAAMLEEFERFQNLDCLTRQARTMGATEDVASLEALEACLDKSWRGEATKEDLRNLRCSISIGGFRCVSCEDETGTVSFAAL